MLSMFKLNITKFIQGHHSLLSHTKTGCFLTLVAKHASMQLRIKTNRILFYQLPHIAAVTACSSRSNRMQNFETLKTLCDKHQGCLKTVSLHRSGYLDRKLIPSRENQKLLLRFHSIKVRDLFIVHSQQLTFLRPL